MKLCVLNDVTAMMPIHFVVIRVRLPGTKLSKRINKQNDHWPVLVWAQKTLHRITCSVHRACFIDH